MSDLNIDQYGLIVHKDGDGGDTMADTFRYLYACHLNGHPNEAMLNDAIKYLFPLKGIGVRHPDQWNDPCDLSRDQQTPAVICLLQYERREMVIHICARHALRGWRYQNLDWASWEHINYYYPRARDWRGDALMLLSSIIRVIGSWLTDRTLYKDINHQVALIQVAVHGHSRWTRAARWIYKTFRYGGVFYPWRKFHAIDNPAIAVEFVTPVTRYILNDQ